MFHTAPLQAEQVLEVPSIPQGMYCHELPDDPSLLEIGAQGTCTECGKVGYFNISRITRPAGADLQSCADMQIGNIRLIHSDLKPQLVRGGPDPESRLCPTCHLAWLDPVNFQRKEDEDERPE